MAVRGSNEAPTMAVEVFSHSRRSCRRSIGLLLDMLLLQVPFAKFVREIVTGAPAQGHNGPRRILATGTDECATVDDKQILHVMRLLKLIENGSLWIGSHARRAEFMNGPALGKHAAADAHDLESRGLEHLLRGLFHVLGHAVLVVAELVVKTQRRNAPFVSYHGINVHVIFVARQDLAESAHTDRKSTRLNSSHSQISYAVFCLKKKKNKKTRTGCIVIPVYRCALPRTHGCR